MFRPAGLLFVLLLCCIVASPADAGSEVPPAPVVAAAIPAHIQAGYNVISNGIKAATITETFTRDKDSYRIESTSRAEGIVALFKPEVITVISEGSVTGHGLRPLTFTNQRKLDSERNSRADFDWANSRITLNDRNGEHTLPLPAGTQDRLSAMYQFMYAPLENATALDFYMTNGSKLDIYNYLLTPDKSVTVPLGTFKAMYLTNQPKAGESQTEIWLATGHFHFPCKMVITAPDGDKFIQELTRLDFIP